jgi:hypothetical protein
MTAEDFVQRPELHHQFVRVRHDNGCTCVRTVHGLDPVDFWVKQHGALPITPWEALRVTRAANDDVSANFELRRLMLVHLTNL